MTYYGAVYQKIYEELVDQTAGIEVTVEQYHRLVPYSKPEEVKCLNYFIGRKYAEYTSDQKTSFTLTADGIAAFIKWFNTPPPKNDFL